LNSKVLCFTKPYNPQLEQAMNTQREALRDLAFIKRTMESAGRYGNISGAAYVSAGLMALLGCLFTYLLLGSTGLAGIGAIGVPAILLLALIWSLVFLFSVLFGILFSIQNAKRLKLSAWNALAARMFLSQMPLVAAAGVITLMLTAKGMYVAVPSVWLLCYGAIAFSFSYFTGLEHRIQGVVFLLLGTIATAADPVQALWLLGIGFGLVHIVFGIIRLARERKS